MGQLSGVILSPLSYYPALGPTLISIPEEFMHSLSCVYIYAEKEWSIIYLIKHKGLQGYHSAKRVVMPRML